MNFRPSWILHFWSLVSPLRHHGHLGQDLRWILCKFLPIDFYVNDLETASKRVKLKKFHFLSMLSGCQMASLPIFLRFYIIYLYSGDSIRIMKSRDRQYVRLHFKSIVTCFRLVTDHGQGLHFLFKLDFWMNWNRWKINKQFTIFRLKFQPRLQEAIKLLFCLQLRHIWFKIPMLEQTLIYWWSLENVFWKQPRQETLFMLKNYWAEVLPWRQIG